VESDAAMRHRLLCAQKLGSRTRAELVADFERAQLLVQQWVRSSLRLEAPLEAARARRRTAEAPTFVLTVWMAVAEMRAVYAPTSEVRPPV
jgi:hypothetical protein